MSHTTFFVGDRSVDEFTISLHDGKAVLSCAVVERWEEVISRPLSCGTEYEYELTQRFGIRTTEKAEIEAAVSASLGIKGIAEFKSEIKTKTGRELQLEEAHEIKEKYKFKAPECGRLTVLIYQLKRLYHFSYEDTRFLHRDKWTRTVTEWVSRIHDATKSVKNDPNCGCKPEFDTGIDGECYLDFGRLTMSIGYIQDQHGVEFPAINARYNGPAHFSGYGNVEISSKYIPAHLLFLAGEQSEVLLGNLWPSAEEQQTHPEEKDNPIKDLEFLLHTIIQQKERVIGELQNMAMTPEEKKARMRSRERASLKAKDTA